MMQMVSEIDTQSPTLLARLRSETSAIHDALHKSSAFEPLASGTMTSTQYRELMIGFYGYYCNLDQSIGETVAALRKRVGRYTYQPRTPLFVRDLKALGLTDNTLRQIMRCEKHPAITTYPALLGAVYVIEGSTLGGSVLERAARSVNPSAMGREYWAWCRQNGGARWRSTLKLLADGELSKAEQDTTVDVARATFQVLQKWFDERRQGLELMCGG